MTNNEKPSAMPALAEALIAHDVDIPEAITALRIDLTPAAFTELALLLDCCPIHMTDLDSCADDDLDDCKHLRS
jgi:hypothetical protein